MDKQKKMDLFFEKGLFAFNKKNFFDAHEHWEDLWTNFYFKDRLFVQGLIQVSVGYYHITNLNLKGARGLFKKCLPKLEKFKESNQRIENLSELIYTVKNAKKCVDEIEDSNDFNWELIINLKAK